MRTNDTNPTPLTDHIADTNPEAANDLEKGLYALCLPVPDESQYLKRRHKDYLVPVTRCGVTLHIKQTTEPAPITPHDRILQPLGEFRSKHWRIRILPGVHLRSNEEEAKQLRETLMKDGIDFHDDVVQNVGNLPYKTPEFPNGVSVVIDPDATSANAHFNPLGHPNPDAPQQQLYAELRQEFASAIAAPTTDEMRQDMRAFWKLCEAKRKPEGAQEPALVAGWQNVQKVYGGDSRSRNLKDIAANYAPSISQHWISFDRNQPRRDATGVPVLG